MKRYTRLLAMVLSLVLCLTLLPAAALAEDNSEDFSLVAEEAESPSETAEASAAEDIVADAPAQASAEENPDGIIEEMVVEVIIPGGASVANNDDLFAGYVNQTLYESNNGTMMLSAEIAGDQLRGNNKIMYDTLKPQIEQIAAGELSSTKIGVPLSSLLTKYVYTAEELGVTEITEENVSALYQTILACDTENVVNTLLADCPYELYWFNKTVGVAIKVQCAVTKTRLVFSNAGTISFSFSVASEYAADPTVSPSYNTDTAKTGAATQAAANAQNIVAAAADYTDYDKLAYYRMQICDLVSYNSDAAEGSVSYGDPWQLIYVFDGDPDTNVVCEGYAKAFQYLCELTEFASDEIYSILATGTIEHDTQSAAHMWNVVHMPDGKNYMVDVTNCDTGAIGAPDKLFLCGADDGSMDLGRYSILVTETESVTYYYAYETSSVFPYTYLELNREGSFDALDAPHAWSDWTMDESTGIHTRTCAVCGLTETCMPGDVYRDYEVNLLDLLILKNVLNGADWDIYTNGADVNWDGTVDQTDLLLLKQQLANA